MKKLILITIAILLMVTAIPIQIYLYYNYLSKIASISEGYRVAVGLSQCIAVIVQAGLSVAILFIAIHEDLI